VKLDYLTLNTSIALAKCQREHGIDYSFREVSLDTMEELAKRARIVDDLAEFEPPTYTDGDGVHCGLCVALLEHPSDDDPTHHLPGCPWRRAKELTS